MTEPLYATGTQEYGSYEGRLLRNRLLAETDWIVIKEREEGGSVPNFAAWKTYRQELRDFTDGLTVPMNDKGYTDWSQITLPTKPSES